MNLSVAALSAPPSFFPFLAPSLFLPPLVLPPPSVSPPSVSRKKRKKTISLGWVKPFPHIIANDANFLMRAILSAEDSGEDYILLPSGGRVNIHPSIVAVAAGMATCKSCGVRATTAVEFSVRAKNGSSALWFIVIAKDGSWLPMTADHVVPESLGGATHSENLRCLCRKCNQKKANHMVKGMKVEKRYHTSNIISVLAKNNPHLSAGRPAYHRLLKDRASKLGAEKLLPGNHWMNPWEMKKLRLTLLSSYGLRLEMPENCGKLFPAVPPRIAKSIKA